MSFLKKILPLTAACGIGSIGYIINEENEKTIKQNEKKRKYDVWKTLNKTNPDKYNEQFMWFDMKDAPKSSGWISLVDDEGESHIGLKSAIGFKNSIESGIIKNGLEDTENIDLVINIKTCGGEVGAVKMICDSIDTFKQKHKGKVHVIVDSHAFSGGTIIALSADNIIMNDYACLGKIDPQLICFPLKNFDYKDAPSKDGIMKVVEKLAEDCFGTLEDICDKHIKPKYDDTTYKNILDELITSKKIHSHSYTKADCKKLGLPIEDIPTDLFIKG